MRITDTRTYRFYLEQLAQNRQATNRSLEQFSDQKRVRRVSDDPAAASESLSLRARLVRTQGLTESGKSARAQLAELERAIGAAIGLVTEAHTKATAAASDTQQTSATVQADEIDSLRDQLLVLANSEFRGTYLFSGTETLTTSFDSTGTYAGNSAAAQAPIESGQTVGVTLDGSQVFQGAGDLFATLSNLSTAIRNGDSATIQTSITELDAELDHLSLGRGQVGNRWNRVDNTLTRLGDEQLSLQTRISQIEDVPLEQIILDLSSLDTSYQALSSAGARIFSRSLFDYLG